MKRNIYLAQINYLHGKSTFLPYAVGTLIANAKANDEVDSFFDFKEPFFIRADQDNILKKIDSPFLFGFSNYIWNHEYNKVLAKRIKELYPDCYILFGGHHISNETTVLENEDYVDFLIFGEGEETFTELLLALKNNTPLSEINNIAFRQNGKIIRTPSKKPQRIDYPSPYLSGVFDSIINNYPDIDFHAIIETNRGCPYKCAYCDWGSLNSKIRFFPEEKVMAELKWFSDHNIRGFGCADSNFGMFERDEKFVDEMVRLNHEYGVLNRFQVSSAKNSNERVFRISKKMNECGMDKGATLSFQSMSEEVLRNIYRTNIPIESFTALLNMYNEAGFATFSELILGLPGETYESFIEGIDILLDAGQHNSIYIHNCEWLPCSAMSDKEYISKHGLEYVVIPLNESHTVIDKNEEIIEKSRLIVRTNTMSREDWVRMNVYSTTIQCFHHEGLLMHFALYLRNEKGIRYSDFYQSLIDYLVSDNTSLSGKIYHELIHRFVAVSRGESGIIFEDRRFGDVGWPSEEYVFLNIAYEIDRFYDEIKPFLKQYFSDTDVFESLYTYQKNVIKLPFIDKIEFTSDFDFKNYFSAILKGKHSPLETGKCHYIIDNTVKCDSWSDYARFVIWYGRKGSRNIYLDEIKTL